MPDKFISVFLGVMFLTSKVWGADKQLVPVLMLAHLKNTKGTEETSQSAYPITRSCRSSGGHMTRRLQLALGVFFLGFKGILNLLFLVRLY
ncbi:unnamed protein product [Prunus armeniaca]